MEKEYKKAPAILTGKDIDYLKDIFGWNYAYYKVCEDAILNVDDEEISKMLGNATKMFDDNMKNILNILENGGNCDE